MRPDVCLIKNSQTVEQGMIVNQQKFRLVWINYAAADSNRLKGVTAQSENLRG